MDLWEVPPSIEGANDTNTKVVGLIVLGVQWIKICTGKQGQHIDSAFSGTNSKRRACQVMFKFRFSTYQSEISRIHKCCDESQPKRSTPWMRRSCSFETRLSRPKTVETRRVVPQWTDSCIKAFCLASTSTWKLGNKHVKVQACTSMFSEQKKRTIQLYQSVVSTVASLEASWFLDTLTLVLCWKASKWEPHKV